MQHNLVFEGNVLKAADDIKIIAQNLLKFNNLELDRAAITVHFAAREQTQESARHLDFLKEKLPALAFQTLRENLQELAKMEAVFENLHPENVLRRGYSITRSKGKVIASPADVKPGDALETRFWTGVVNSNVA